MIILLNAPTILHEVMRAGRIRLAYVMGVPLDWVELKLVQNEETGKTHPEVDINVPDEVPEEYRKSKLFTESKEWVHEKVGQVVRTAIREYEIRKEGARA